MREKLERLISCWRRYQAAEPWRRMDSDAVFRIEDEKSGESYYASVMGRRGTLYGLALNRGEEGLASMGGLVEGEVDRDQAVTISTSICVTRHDGPVPDWYREFVVESLGPRKGFGGLPFFYVNEAVRGPRLPDAGEIHLLADTLDAIATLVERGALNPPVFQPGSPMPCIHLRSGGDLEITEETPEFRPPRVAGYQVPPERRAGLRKLPRLDCTDLVSCSLAPALVQGRKIRMLIVAEAERDFILAGECTELEDSEAIAKRLLSAYEGGNADRRVGLPREIQTDSRYFYECFKDTLGEIGIRVVCFEHISALERLRESFADFLERG